MTDDIDSQLMRDAVQAYGKEFEHVTALWRDLDSKAQAAVTVAGVFAAAAFAIVQAGVASLGTELRVLLLFSIVTLACAVLAAVRAARARAVIAPPAGTLIQRMADDLILRAPEDLAARLPDYMRDQCRLWEETNISYRAAVESKAASLRLAQTFLIAAILSFLILSAWRVLQ